MKRTPIDHNCTIAKMAEQLGIKLWQAMEMMKFAGKTLSDDELKEILLPLKKIDNGARDTAGILENCLQVNHETIDSVIKALSDRIPRGLSREHFRTIMSEHTPTIAEDSQQPERTQGELDKAYDDLMGEGIGSAMLKQAPR